MRSAFLTYTYTTYSITSRPRDAGNYSNFFRTAVEQQQQCSGPGGQFDSLLYSFHVTRASAICAVVYTTVVEFVDDAVLCIMTRTNTPARFRFVIADYAMRQL